MLLHAWVAALAATVALPGAFDLNTAPARVVQPVHEYFTPVGEHAPPEDRGTYNTTFTHLGTDFASMGPGRGRVRWEPGGRLRVNLRGSGWAGMWHSLAGLGREPDRTLDFTKCFPPVILDPYQPKCVGVSVRAAGSGRLRLEIKGADQTLQWAGSLELNPAGGERILPVDPAGLRTAKYLNWIAEGGTDVAIDALGLVIEYPPLAFPDRVFLISYAKLARAAIPGAGLVRDQAHRPAGAFEGVPASGLYALATAAAADRGFVARAVAEGVLRETYQAIAALPKADGWLPHFVSRVPDGKYRTHPGTEYSTIDTSLTYHGLLLAATMLGDQATLDRVASDIRALRFDKLRHDSGYLRMGFATNGTTPLLGAWAEWGGESALVVLLERMARGPGVVPKMNPSGAFPDGVGFIAEIQSLFYPQFDRDEPDALTGVNWRAARQSLANTQRAAVARHPRGQRAAAAGLFGVSAGEGFRGRSYVSDGLRGLTFEVLHPHYMLMAGQADPSPGPTYARLREAEAVGVLSAWGLVENVAVDLSEYLPTNVSLNAAFEAIAAYHLASRAAKRPDAIYQAARKCELTAGAVQVFYPNRSTDALSEKAATRRPVATKP
ncbi:MAG: hypothetical protein U0871_26400 [Gemmataceae bacterium]